MRKMWYFLLSCFLLTGLLAGCDTASEPVTVWCITGVTLSSAESDEAYPMYAFTYNENGQLLEKSRSEDGNMVVTERYTYNKKGELTTFEQCAQSTVATYDSQGNVLTAKGPDLSVKNTYDKHGNLLTSTRQQTGEEPQTTTYKYTYDTQGRVTACSHGELESTYTYNSKGNLLCQRDADKNGYWSQTDYRYNEHGQLLEQTHTGSSGNTKKTTYTYDASGNVLTQVYLLSGHSMTHRYTYDAAGNRIKLENYQDDTLMSETQWTYDTEGRMLSQQTDSGNSTSLQQWTYDSQGNINTWQHNNTTASRFLYKQVQVPAALAESVRAQQEKLLQELTEVSVYQHQTVS